MDPNGGIDPLSQGNSPGQPAGGPEPQYQQQAPMVSPQVAYSQPMDQPVSQGVAQPQVNNNPVVPQPPIQDVKPSWQQDLQYQQPDVSTPAPQPQQSYISSYDSFQQPQPEQQGPSSDAYSLLTEPTADFAQAAKPSSPKKPIFVVLVALGALLIISGAVAVGFNFGFQKGSADSAATQQPAQEGESDVVEEETPEQVEEPELSFELTKPTFAEEILSASLGEQLIASDGLVLNVYNVDEEYVPESEDAPTGETKYIKVDMVVGNADDSRPKTITTNSFKLVDDFGDLIEPLDELSDGLGGTGSVTLDSGMIDNLSVVFKVETFSSSLQLVRSQPYQVSGQTRNVSMQIRLTGSNAEDIFETR